MAELSQLPFKYRMFLRSYRWRKIDPVPWTPLAKPLAESRVALISSAGFTHPEQQDFDEEVRGGDPSFRDIPWDVDPRELASSHRSDAFDPSGVEQDTNLAFPIDRIRELAEAGRIGSVNRRHLSMMGSLTATARLVRQTAPEAVARLVADEVDVALLVPV